IQEVPRPYTGQTVQIPWPTVFKNLLRKPRSVTHSQFIRMLPDAMQQYVMVKELEVRKDRLQALAHWSDVYTVQQIQETLEQEGNEATVACLTAALGVQQG
ncbi:hypothetical protein M3661_30045, partial [Paenibacillus sp. MER 180]|nr:hypothetical protein [Paenibacillus sp. MER 180]